MIYTIPEQPAEPEDNAPAYCDYCGHELVAGSASNYCDGDTCALFAELDSPEDNASAFESEE